MKSFNLARAGFTLAEMILVVAILSILLGVSTPAIYGFIKQRDIQSEENTLQELRRALQAHLADKNAMPPAVGWAEALAGYTNLSAVEMVSDTWGSPRSYIQFVDTSRKIQGADVAINYATFLSAGPDRKASSIANMIPVIGDAFANHTNSGWWANQAGNQVAQFGKLASGGDDLMAKFTDYAEKLDRYKLTLQRMDRVASAVESIARVNYGSEVARCASYPRDSNGLVIGDPTGLCNTAGAIEKIIYYPIGFPTNNTGWDISLHYYNTVAVASQARVNNGGTDPQRRADMVQLMRMLGLPDDFCCSALEMSTEDGKPEPFFYFSNPRPRGISGGCGNRPGVNDQKLPARLSTINNDAVTTPTCG
jgi:prepilin-type N-terminal cleavage/methylation domain-containing protein